MKFDRGPRRLPPGGPLMGSQSTSTLSHGRKPNGTNGIIKLAEQPSEASLRDFIEAAPVAMHSVSADGTILWANQAELDLVGYSREEYIGCNITQFHDERAVIDDFLLRLSQGET